MIKFEEHDGLIFKMLDKPVPLTDDTELPVLVRMIQNDTMLGKANKRSCHPDTLAIKIICNELTDDGLFMDGNYTYRYEIIGYHIAEGSAEWALYQMMQGKKVSYKRAIGNVYWAINQDGNVQYYDTDNPTYIGRIRSKLEFGKRHVVNTGWQLYKEPKIEPPKEPDYVICKRCGGTGYEIKPEPAKEQFEVGDWVEYRLDRNTYYGKICNIRGYVYYLSVTTEEIPKDQARAIMLESIIRKIFPREVIVHIGCLSGTIRYCLSFDNDGAKHDAIKIFNSNGKSIAAIHLEALDTETRELVEGLLKAQEEAQE